MVPFDRFTVVLDACTLFPMLTRDILLTMASVEFSDSRELQQVSAKDRHVVATAIAAHADAIVTFNTADFAPPHLLAALQIEVKHPDDFVMDLVVLNEKRAAVAFRELRTRKTNPPWDREELIRRTRGCGMVQTSLWLANDDVAALI